MEGRGLEFGSFLSMYYISKVSLQATQSKQF